MKKVLVLLFAIAMVATTSCEKIKEALDFEFDTSFKANINAIVPPATLKATMGDFTASATIDPMSNEQFSEYAHVIKSINVQEIKGKITAISKPTLLINGTVSMTSEEMAAAEWTFTNVQLEVGTELVMDNAAGQFANMKNILDTKKAFTVTMSGTTEDDDLTFTLEVSVNSKVVANPL
jgi:hypothetical protein